jgi:predicted RNase H-like HicB family nuclease
MELQDAISAWIEAMTKAGNAIPDPAIHHVADAAE